MTMNINEDILAEVMRETGIASKTRAVEAALKEMARRAKFHRLLDEGLGLSKEELENAWEEPRFAAKPQKTSQASKSNERRRSHR